MHPDSPGALNIGGRIIDEHAIGSLKTISVEEEAVDLRLRF
jgi:hypothetical protein